MDIREKAAAWVRKDPDPQTRQMIAELLAADSATAKAQLAAYFHERLTFGTAGLRGRLGPGPACMNRLVVRETTWALGQYLQQKSSATLKAGVVIGYDARHGSLEFAVEAAGVLGALGFNVYLGSTLMPTPLCAYAVQSLQAAAGIMITASHNPSEYNGYKIYLANGAQLSLAAEQALTSWLSEKILNEANIACLDLTGLTETAPVSILDTAHLHADYLQDLERVFALYLVLTPGERKRYKIAYTPLQGVGGEYALQTLKHFGFTNVEIVESQMNPDPEFLRVADPNPEKTATLQEVRELAVRTGSRLALANDPDADRLAVAMSNDGVSTILSGDDVGSLLGAYLLDRALQSKQAHELCVGTTLVSSRLLSRIAKNYGVECFTTLTGFKWLLETALAKKERGKKCLFAYEEALGYYVSELVNDKDGLGALVLLSELAAYLESQGLTLETYLYQLYRQYGLFVKAQETFVEDTSSWWSTLTALKAGHQARRQLGELPILALTDLSLPVGERTWSVKASSLTPEVASWLEEETELLATLPSSPVLIYHLALKTRLLVRPSGTEPKLKLYGERELSLAPELAIADIVLYKQQAQTPLQALMQQWLKDLHRAEKLDA